MSQSQILSLRMSKRRIALVHKAPLDELIPLNASASARTLPKESIEAQCLRLEELMRPHLELLEKLGKWSAKRKVT